MPRAVVFSLANDWSRGVQLDELERFQQHFFGYIQPEIVTNWVLFVKYFSRNFMFVTKPLYNIQLGEEAILRFKLGQSQKK